MFSWIDSYRKLAEGVLLFRTRQQDLIDRVVAAFTAEGVALPKVDVDGRINRLDPFTLFGFVNRGITFENRIKMFRAVARAVDVEVEVPTDFDGVPVLNNQRLCFTAFSTDKRLGKDDVEHLWDVFEATLRYDSSDESSRMAFVKAWDIAIAQYFVKWNLSMGVFWIRPDVFVNLDLNNREYIADTFPDVPEFGMLRKNKVPVGHVYLSVCDCLLDYMKKPNAIFDSLCAMSQQAWQSASRKDSDMYWLTANPEFWALTGMSVGQTESYTFRNEAGNLRHDAKAFSSICVGDFIFGYQAKDVKSLVSVLRCVKIEKDERVYFKKVYDLNAPIHLDTLRENNDLNGLPPVKSLQGSLFRLKDVEADVLREMVEVENKAVFDDEPIEEGSFLRKGDSVNMAGVTVWFWAPGAQGSEWNACKKDGFVCLGWDEVGPYDHYRTREELESAIAKTRPEGSPRPKNASLACWAFLKEVKEGDIFIAKQGLSRLLGIGVIRGEYKYDESRTEYKNVRKCDWMDVDPVMSPVKLPMKALTNMNPWPEIVDKVQAALVRKGATIVSSEHGLDVEEEDGGQSHYGRDEFLRDVFMSADEYDCIARLLTIKKNVILTGAPGVGKTYAAKRLAWSLIGTNDNTRQIGFVQFHQSYSYEDFIGGYKPKEDGSFEYRQGVFAEFCERAAKHLDKPYCFVIDEINRGNLSKIFGELLMLIEADKRNEEVMLAGTGEPFSVPDNVYIIGMMNTADRSLAMMDYALRRRFSFYPIKPGFSKSGFESVVTDVRMRKLVAAVVKLNQTIMEDPSLGEGFVIGHSYFINSSDNEKKNPDDVLEFDLAPTLKEYWFDNPETAEHEIGELRKAIR